MKKLFSSILILAVLSALSLPLLTSCDGDLEGLSVQGIYYEYIESMDALDEETWIELRGYEWGDSAGHKGSFEISGEIIALFVVEGEESVEYAAGTVSGGELALEMRGSERVYRRE